MRRLRLATLFLCLSAFAAGCFEWSEDSQGNLQSVGLPGIPVWQSNAKPPAVSPTDIGFTPEEAAKMSGPVLVMPTANGMYRYRYYETGQNHCQEDVQKILASRAAYPTNDPAPFCTEHPTQPPAPKSGSLFGF